MCNAYNVTTNQQAIRSFVSITHDHIGNMEESIATGTVKFFNSEKGFGFISPENGGPDIFVHVSALQASGIQALRDGQKVAFDTEPDRRGKGPKAINIELATL